MKYLKRHGDKVYWTCPICDEDNLDIFDESDTLECDYCLARVLWQEILNDEALEITRTWVKTGVWLDRIDED